jgi:hypothetical protein
MAEANINAESLLRVAGTTLGEASARGSALGVAALALGPGNRGTVRIPVDGDHRPGRVAVVSQALADIASGAGAASTPIQGVRGRRRRLHPESIPLAVVISTERTVVGRTTSASLASGTTHRLRIAPGYHVNGVGIAADEKPTADEAVVDGAEKIFAVLKPVGAAFYYSRRYPERSMALVEQILRDEDSDVRQRSAAYRIWAIVLRDQGDTVGARDRLEVAEALTNDRAILASIRLETGYLYRLERRWHEAALAFATASELAAKPKVAKSRLATRSWRASRSSRKPIARSSADLPGRTRRPRARVLRGARTLAPVTTARRAASSQSARRPTVRSATCGWRWLSHEARPRRSDRHDADEMPATGTFPGRRDGVRAVLRRPGVDAGHLTGRRARAFRGQARHRIRLRHGRARLRRDTAVTPPAALGWYTADLPRGFPHAAGGVHDCRDVRWPRAYDPISGRSRRTRTSRAGARGAARDPCEVLRKGNVAAQVRASSRPRRCPAPGSR